MSRCFTQGVAEGYVEVTAGGTARAATSARRRCTPHVCLLDFARPEWRGVDMEQTQEDHGKRQPERGGGWVPMTVCTVQYNTSINTQHATAAQPAVCSHLPWQPAVASTQSPTPPRKAKRSSRPSSPSAATASSATMSVAAGRPTAGNGHQPASHARRRRRRHPPPCAADPTEAACARPARAEKEEREHKTKKQQPRAPRRQHRLRVTVKHIPILTGCHPPADSHGLRSLISRPRVRRFGRHRHRQHAERNTTAMLDAASGTAAATACAAVTSCPPPRCRGRAQTADATAVIATETGTQLTLLPAPHTPPPPGEPSRLTMATPAAHPVIAAAKSPCPRCRRGTQAVPAVRGGLL